MAIDTTTKAGMMLTRSQFTKAAAGAALAAMLSGSALSSALAQTAAEEPEPKQTHEPGSTIEGAILYTVSGEEGELALEYNVVYAAPIDPAAVEVTDAGETGIAGYDALVEAMGEADLTALEFTPDPGERTLGSCVTANVTLDDAGAVASIEVLAVTPRPVVGISWKRDEIGDDYKGFAEAFERNGAYCVFLPQVTSDEEAVEVLSVINGIFMTGGEDWNPSLYDQVQSPHGSSGWNDARDTSDLAYMQNAIALDVPMLCVCRGMQGFNVAMGGALIQDIPFYLGQKVINGEIDVERVSGVVSGTLPGSDETVQDTGYRMYDENYAEVGRTYDKDTETYMEGTECIEGHLRVQVDGIIHSGGDGYHILDAGVEGIGISPDSKWLYDIYGSDTVELIATAHHQAADPEQLGEGLTVVSMSSDGIIEAIEHQDSLFALGLQFHPERDALRDARGVDVDNDLSNAPLRALVTYAGVHAGFVTVE